MPEAASARPVLSSRILSHPLPPLFPLIVFDVLTIYITVVVIHMDRVYCRSHSVLLLVTCVCAGAL